MKKNLEKLNRIFRLTNLKPEMFYSISVSEFEIQMQGSFHSDTVIVCSKYDKGTITSNGYMEFVKNNVKITLTEQPGLII